jgi:hypothetical protein
VARGILAVVVVVGRLAGGHGHCLGRRRWRQDRGGGGVGGSCVMYWWSSYLACPGFI